MQVRIVLREYMRVERERTRVCERLFARAVRGILDFCGSYSLSLCLLSLFPLKKRGNLSPFQSALLEGMRGIATRELRFKRVERDGGCVFRAMWRCGR